MWVAPTRTQGWAPITSGNPYQGLHEFSQRFFRTIVTKKEREKIAG